MDSLRGGPATAQIRAGLHRFRCNCRCFPLRLLAQFAGERISDSAERVVDKFLVARAAFTLPKESGNVLGGEVERRTAMQAVQPCL